MGGNIVGSVHLFEPDSKQVFIRRKAVDCAFDDRCANCVRRGDWLAIHENKTGDGMEGFAASKALSFTNSAAMSAAVFRAGGVKAGESIFMI
jgi:hypothetical protein